MLTLLAKVSSGQTPIQTKLTDLASKEQTWLNAEVQTILCQNEGQGAYEWHLCVCVEEGGHDSHATCVLIE